MGGLANYFIRVILGHWGKLYRLIFTSTLSHFVGVTPIKIG